MKSEFEHPRSSPETLEAGELAPGHPPRTGPIRRLYDWVLHWADTRHGPTALGALSFAESSFFPIPPDVMLAPMVLAERRKAWAYALLTTVTSVAGGLAGFAIGALAIDWVMPLLERFGVTATCRASFAMYNTREEVDALVRALKKAQEFFS